MVGMILHLLIALIIINANVAMIPGRYCTNGTVVWLAAQASTQNHQPPPKRAPARPGPYAFAYRKI
jgi:hypothetical protein